MTHPTPYQTGAPTRLFDPNSFHDWVNVLHNASQVPEGDPQYAAARDVIDQAITQMGHIQRRGQIADEAKTSPRAFGPRGPVSASDGSASAPASAILPFLHSASLGVGEPIAGAIDAATGGTFRGGASKYREGMENLEVSNPATAVTAEFLGNAAPLVLPVPGVMARTFAPRLLKGATTGAGIGAVQGFAEGGEDPGSVTQRVEAAKRQAMIGGVAGGILTGVASGGERLQRRVGKWLGNRSADVRFANLKAPTDAVPEVALGGGDPSIMVPPDQTPAWEVHPEVKQAIADYDAGKITGEQLRYAMDFARHGRSMEPTVPLSTTGEPMPTQSVTSVSRATPSELVDQLPPEMQTSRGAIGREGPSPQAPVATLSPAETVDRNIPLGEQTSRGIADLPVRQEIVAPGPYQKAPPGTRMSTTGGPTNLYARAIESGDPELLGLVPESIRRMHYQLGEAMGTYPPARLLSAGERADILEGLRGLASRGGSSAPSPKGEALALGGGALLALPHQQEPTAGLVVPGNIDLTKRPIVRNRDGSISTVRSMSFEEDGKEVLIPTVAADGSRILKESEAIAQYRRTGQHLGKFKDVASANAYAQRLHEEQAKRYLPKPKP